MRSSGLQRSSSDAGRDRLGDAKKPPSGIARPSTSGSFGYKKPPPATGTATVMQTGGSATLSKIQKSSGIPVKPVGGRKTSLDVSNGPEPGFLAPGARSNIQYRSLPRPAKSSSMSVTGGRAGPRPVSSSIDPSLLSAKPAGLAPSRLKEPSKVAGGRAAPAPVNQTDREKEKAKAKAVAMDADSVSLKSVGSPESTPKNQAGHPPATKLAELPPTPVRYPRRLPGASLPPPLLPPPSCSRHPSFLPLPDQPGASWAFAQGVRRFCSQPHTPLRADPPGPPPAGLPGVAGQAAGSLPACVTAPWGSAWGAASSRGAGPAHRCFSNWPFPVPRVVLRATAKSFVKPPSLANLDKVNSNSLDLPSSGDAHAPKGPDLLAAGSAAGGPLSSRFSPSPAPVLNINSASFSQGLELMSALALPKEPRMYPKLSGLHRSMESLQVPMSLPSAFPGSAPVPAPPAAPPEEDVEELAWSGSPRPGQVDR